MTTSPQDSHATADEDTGSVSAGAIADWLTACVADYRETQPSAIDAAASAKFSTQQEVFR